MFIRRLGRQDDSQCVGGYYCAQVLEMKNGNFAACGPLITEEARKEIPPGPGIGPTEGVVEVPRAVMLSAIIDFLRNPA